MLGEVPRRVDGVHGGVRPYRCTGSFSRTWSITDWLTSLPPWVYHWLMIHAEPGRLGLR